MEVGDRDNFNDNALRDNMHDWVVANENMARVLAAKNYHYQFVFARNAGHTDRAVRAQLLPEALEYIWQGTPSPEQQSDSTAPLWCRNQLNSGVSWNPFVTTGSPMNLFKSFTLQWWQAGLFKVGLLALGIAVGAYWHGLFTGFLPALIIIAAICLAYITVVWWKQT